MRVVCFDRHDGDVSAQYEIDPEQNEGEKYQFDAVVRKKADRVKLHGGDCECCRDVRYFYIFTLASTI